MTIKLNSYSMWTEKKYEDDWYDWCVFVDEDLEVINTIRSVEYTLHPTFPNPVRVIKDKTSRFVLFSSGWGGFRIKVRIDYENGSSLKTSFSLQLLRDNWPKKQPPQDFSENETKLVYQALLHEKHRWRKIDTLVKNSNLPKDAVLRILEELQNQDLARKAYYLSIDGKEMWGATAVVGVSPRISKS